MNQSGREQGFTLLEILVALAILGIVMITAVKTSSSTADNAAYLKERTLAHWVAMNRATELQLSTDWVEVGFSDGESIMANREWLWQETVSETVDGNLRRVEIAVRGNKQDEPLSSLIVFIGNPANRKAGLQ